jgi:hypothetical protein
MRDGVHLRDLYPAQASGLVWTIQGVGDFDDDGRADILWRENTGKVVIRFKGNPAGAAAVSYANDGAAVPNDWKIKGVGDFNGNGRSDILWQHDGGAIAIWYLRGAQRVGETYPEHQGVWYVQAVGDFDGDGRSDILWRDPSGFLAISLHGALGGPFERVTWFDLGGSTDFAWTVHGVGDFDRDRKDEIFWRHTDGSLAIWRVDGTRFVNDYPAYGPGPSWLPKLFLSN